MFVGSLPIIFRRRIQPISGHGPFPFDFDLSSLGQLVSIGCIEDVVDGFGAVDETGHAVGFHARGRVHLFEDSVWLVEKAWHGMAWRGSNEEA